MRQYPFIAGAFSGGGAMGAFIIGYIYGLFVRRILFNAVAGVSVGALIASMIAQGRLMECIHFFKTVRDEDVHHKYSNVSKLWRIFMEGRRGLHNPRGLKKMVKENVDRDRLIMPCYAGFVSLHDSNYYALSQVEYDKENFANAVLASALMPVIWEDVPEIKLKDGRCIKNCVDGGIRNNTPLSDILQEQPDKIYIIQCSTGRSEEKEMHSFKDNALRTLDIMLDEIVTNDTRELLKMNSLVKQAQDKGYELINENTGKPYKYYEAVVVRPDESLGNNLDFSESEMLRRFDMGYQQALRDHAIAA